MFSIMNELNILKSYNMDKAIAYTAHTNNYLKQIYYFSHINSQGE